MCFMNRRTLCIKIKEKCHLDWIRLTAIRYTTPVPTSAIIHCVTPRAWLVSYTAIIRLRCQIGVRWMTYKSEKYTAIFSTCKQVSKIDFLIIKRFISIQTSQLLPNSLIFFGCNIIVSNKMRYVNTFERFEFFKGKYMYKK